MSGGRNSRQASRRTALSYDHFLKDLGDGEGEDGNVTAIPTGTTATHSALKVKTSDAAQQENLGSAASSRSLQEVSFASNSSHLEFASHLGGASAELADEPETEPMDHNSSLPFLSTPTAVRAAKNRDVWFSGDLWKLGSGVRDRADLRNWRHRFFQIVWMESVGLVLLYFSEKENCEGQLGCIISDIGGEHSATVSKLPPLDVVRLEEDDQMHFLDSCRQYDLAVHPKKKGRPSYALPSVLHRMTVAGRDAEGSTRKLELAVSDADVLTGWLLILETVLGDRLEEALVW